MKVTGWFAVSSLEAKGDLHMIQRTIRGQTVRGFFCIRSAQRFSFPHKNRLERTSMTLGPASAVILPEVHKREVDSWGKERPHGSDCDPNSSQLLLLFRSLLSTSPTSPYLSRSHSSGINAALRHQSRRPAGWEVTKCGGGSLQACVSLFNRRGTGVVSRDVCNESDASLDVLSAQGARL